MSAATPRRWRCCCALAILVAVTALTACSGGGGTETVQVIPAASPDENGPHPGYDSEWWYVAAIDPGSRTAIVTTLARSPVPFVFGVLYAHGGASSWRAASGRHGAGLPGDLQTNASIRYDARTRSWRLDEHAAGYSVRLRLSHVTAGVTVQGRLDGARQGWTDPVAAGLANGIVLTPAHRRIAVHDWYAYSDHDWGNFALDSSSGAGADPMRSWDWATIQQPHRSAWVFFDARPRSGAAVTTLTRIIDGHATECRPQQAAGTVARSRSGVSYARVLRIRCAGGRILVLKVAQPFQTRVGPITLTESLGSSAGDRASTGIIEHADLAP